MNHNACLCLCLVRDLTYIALHSDCVYMVMVTKAWCGVPGWCTVSYFVYQSACDHYRNLQLSFAKNTAAIEKWNMLYDSFILNFNICMWFSLEIFDSHAFCNEIVRLFLSSMGAAILNHFPPSHESDWKRFHESTPRVAKIMRSRETFSLNLQWRCGANYSFSEFQ